MGFLTTTATLLAALASGNAYLVTQDELNQAHAEIQSACASNAAIHAQLTAEKIRLEADFLRLAAEKSQYAAEWSKAMLSALQNNNHAWDIGQREYDLLFAQLPVENKKWNKLLVVASVALAVTVLYTIKRVYDAQSSTQTTEHA